MYNLKLVDCRLATFDPTDLNGFPYIKDGRSHYAPPAQFPLSTDKLPKDASVKVLNRVVTF